jgi:hypothetical protein
VAEGSLVGFDLAAFGFAAVDSLNLAVPPAGPHQRGGFVAGQPSLARTALRWQRDFDDAVVELLVGVVVDGGAQHLEIGTCAADAFSLLDELATRLSADLPHLSLPVSSWLSCRHFGSDLWTAGMEHSRVRFPHGPVFSGALYFADFSTEPLRPL